MGGDLIAYVNPEWNLIAAHFSYKPQGHVQLSSLLFELVKQKHKKINAILFVGKSRDLCIAITYSLSVYGMISNMTCHLLYLMAIVNNYISHMPTAWEGTADPLVIIPQVS